MRLPARVPIESPRPLVVFAVVRLLLSLLALGIVDPARFSIRR